MHDGARAADTRIAQGRPEPIDAWLMLLQVHRMLTADMAGELDSLGLSLEYYDVLMTLHTSPTGRLRVTDLQERVMLSQSGVSRLVARMEADGYLKRGADPADGRAVLLEATSLGRSLHAQAQPRQQRMIEKWFLAPMTPEQIGTVANGLQAVLHACLRRRAAAVGHRQAGH